MPSVHTSLISTSLHLLPRPCSLPIGRPIRRAVKPLTSSSAACHPFSSPLLPTSARFGCYRRFLPLPFFALTARSASFSSSGTVSSAKLPMPPSYFWAQSHEDTPPLSVAVYQGPTVIGGLDAALQHMRDIASRARAQGTQLLCFPEVALQPPHASPPVTRRLQSTHSPFSAYYTLSLH
jgi:hypothetical protein